MIVALVVGTWSSGCRSGVDTASFGGRVESPVSIQVENNDFLDVTIYVTLR